MNLRRRGAARDPATAALDTTAAGRFLATAAISPARIWVIDASPDMEASESDVIGAWSHGIAVVRVRGSAARDAALATARSAGIDTVAGPPASDKLAAPADGARLAARFEFGLWPDETVELVLGRAALLGLDDRLAAFDATLATDPTPRRLVLAGLSDHGPKLAPDLVSAIVHPQVLVELRPSDEGMLAALRRAADAVIVEPRGG